jgi:hypothetical protein
MIASLTGFLGSTLTAQSQITNQVIFSELGPQIVLNIEACFFPFWRGLKQVLWSCPISMVRPEKRTD